MSITRNLRRVLAGATLAVAFAATLTQPAAANADGAGEVTPRMYTDRKVNHFRPNPGPGSDYSAATAKSLDRVGVLTMNAYHNLTIDQATRDAVRATSRKGVHVVGWQEAEKFPKVYDRLTEHGWSTQFFTRGASELAVSWRSSTFELVEANQYRMHFGVGRASGNPYPFPNRYVVAVTLRHRTTGHLFTVLNTHVNQKIEVGGHFRRNVNAARAKTHLAAMREMWWNVPGRYVVGTGDYNFDYVADSRVRANGAPRKAFDGRAVSNWQKLGTRGIPGTLGNRHIDYVFASTRSTNNGWIEFIKQTRLRGYRTDHTPVLVKFDLH